MYLTPDTNYGSEVGIYCHEGKSHKMAELALYSCRNGKDGGKSLFKTRTDTTADGWAVKFGSPPRIRGCFSILVLSFRVIKYLITCEVAFVLFWGICNGQHMMFNIYQKANFL